MSSLPDAEVPLSVRLHFGRAAVQVVADRAHIDVLHLKGDAVDSSLRPIPQPGSDIDVLVRPDDVVRLDALLRDHGWMLYSTFEDGSPFGHAQTYLHDSWGHLDLHWSFPGIRRAPADAFERLWRGRGAMEFAGIWCAVPSVPAQAAILLLNAARGRHRADDVKALWEDSTEEFRRMVDEQIDQLDARLALDAAIGRLELHRGERGYRLWRAVSEDGTRVEEWWGRVVAEPTLRGRIGIVLKAPLVNVEHLGLRLGHAPSRWEIAAEFFARPARGLGEYLGRRSRGDAR